MVRTSVRNIVLTVLKMRHPLLDSYATRFPFMFFYVDVSCQLRDTWLALNKSVLDAVLSPGKSLETETSDMIDFLMFFDDFFRIGSEELNRLLANAMLSYAVFPCLISSLSSPNKDSLVVNLALYLLFQIYSLISHQPLLDIITIELFSTQAPFGFAKLAQKVQKVPLTYSKHFQKESAWNECQPSRGRDSQEIISSSLFPRITIQSGLESQVLNGLQRTMSSPEKKIESFSPKEKAMRKEQRRIAIQLGIENQDEIFRRKCKDKSPLKRFKEFKDFFVTFLVSFKSSSV